jgi:hypothetical protein
MIGPSLWRRAAVRDFDMAKTPSPELFQTHVENTSPRSTHEQRHLSKGRVDHDHDHNRKHDD